MEGQTQAQYSLQNTDFYTHHYHHTPSPDTEQGDQHQVRQERPANTDINTETFI